MTPVADRLRIVGGELGGRRILSVASIRPTQERVREALFSRWADLLADRVFVDLFCGSGSMGLEALSRGAKRAVFVDRAPDSLRATRANLETLGLAARARVLRADLPRQWSAVLAALEAEPGGILIFADPPYDHGRYPELIDALTGLEAVAATAVEHAARRPPGGDREPLDSRVYGDSAVSFF